MKHNKRPKSETPRPIPPVADTAVAEQSPAILVGIDWADQSHAYAMQDASGKVHRATFAQSPEAIAELVLGWQKQYPGVGIAVCIETSRGPLINALLEYPEIQIYPINPNALANYRKAFAHGGGKNDPLDAALILQFLKLYREQLRPLRRNEPITRELAALCEDRRALVEQRVVLSQQLKDLLKTYFPAILALKPAKIYADFVVGLLRKYPTLTEVQAARATQLRKLFFARGTKEKIEERIKILMEAKPLVTDEVLLRTSARRAQALAAQLRALNQAIAGYEEQIDCLVKQHADYAIVKSLPCGIKSKARIIAALGDDRTRYGSATQLASATGIAPLTTQSGRQHFVSSRWACSKFLKQTFHEFAAVSIKKSTWAKAFYDQQCNRNKSAIMAQRALAYKWIRILYRCWQTREAYDEARYLKRLGETKSPLAAKLVA